LAGTTLLYFISTPAVYFSQCLLIEWIDDDKPGIKLCGYGLHAERLYVRQRSTSTGCLPPSSLLSSIIITILSFGKRSSAIITAIFCWLLLVGGYPADVIYLFYILLAMLLAGAWHKRKELRNSAYGKCSQGIICC
jgi:hypothetical protein